MGELNRNFRSSIEDLIDLLDKGYPKKASIELVGNRYRLDHDQRMILYRGVFDTKSSEERLKKLVEPERIKIRPVIIDGYNVLITIESYLKGKLVFRSLDGLVRDISGLYGSYTFSDFTLRSASLLTGYIGEEISRRQGSSEGDSGPAGILLLDYPVSKSGELAAYLRESAAEQKIDLEVEVVKSPDEAIISTSALEKNAAVATSDTVIIDSTSRYIDIPYSIINGKFKKEVLDLAQL
jgi:hypothetical protein